MKKGFVAVAFCLTLLLSACADPTPPSDAAGVGKVKDTITQNGYIMTLNSVERNKSLGAGKNAKEGNIYLFLDITITSDKDYGVESNPNFARVRDGQGNIYNPVAGKTPPLTNSTNLPKGDKARGFVTFEVPEKATGLVYEYLSLSGMLLRFNLS